jgi:ABC-type sugar transport system permease subunit
MQTKKKVGLGQNNFKSKLFYTLLVLLPSLQFFLFYIVVNINSIALSFKIFEGGNITKPKPSWENFTRWFGSGNEIGRDALIPAIGVSVKSYLISLAIGVPMGLFFSYYMFKRMPGSSFFRIMLFTPSILSATVLAIIFKPVSMNIIGGTEGFLYKLLDGEIIDFWKPGEPYNYAGMMFFSIFVSFGTSVLMYTNKMDAIDPEIVESAHLDGANGIKEFWYVILPQAFSIVQVFLITGFAGIFSNQMNAHILFGWDPGAKAQTVGYLLWRGVNKAGGNIVNMTPYAALGLMITVVIVPLTFLFRWAIDKIGWKEE